ncbi:MAG: hypothetical protein JWQ04_367 [Pedosphaera sp.]|nr:hypothetical protein [Pedosphaera sp.]
MPMKLSLALGPRQPLSRQMAWGCFTTNLAMPGFGSLLGGRAIGYAQIPFTVIGFGLTMVGGIRTILWAVSNWTRMRTLQENDPVGYLLELWANFRWPLLGMAVFLFVLLWALITSRSIMSQASAAERLAAANRPLPPKLGGR